MRLVTSATSVTSEELALARFQGKERPLFVQAAGVAGELAARADDAVARHDDADRIAPGRRPSRARTLGKAGAARPLPVADRLAVGHARDRLPHALLEIRSGRIELE